MSDNHTLESIAELAGVSRATVSRVINDKDNVSPKVRKKVLSIIERENYYPNASARSLASNRTNNIGVVFWGYDPVFLSNPIYYEILQGIQKETLEHNLDLVLYTTEKEEKKRKDLCYKIIGQKNVDGVIIMGAIMYIDYLRLFCENNLPVTIIGKRNMEDLDIPYVCSDYEMGLFQATEHLIDLGRKKIVMIQSDINVQFQTDKLVGYKKALKKEGINVNEDFILKLKSRDEEYLEKIVKKLLLQYPKINGIVCDNDNIAQQVIKVLGKLDIKVPESISVVGFNDVITAKNSNPSLTTIRQNKIALGINAVRLLKQSIDDEKAKNKILPTQLIVRESTSSLE